MKHLLNILATVTGAGAMGSLSVFASQGGIPWWLVVLVFVWAISLGLYVMVLGFEGLDKAYAHCLKEHSPAGRPS